MNNLLLKRPLLLVAITSLAVGLTTGQPASSQEAAPTKKLILSGWNIPSAEDVRKNWREIDKLPLDGFAVSLPVDATKPTTGDGSSVNRLGWNVFGAKPLQLQSFKTSIDDLKSAQWKNISAIFLPVAAASLGQDQGLSWFDDTRWKTINNNWRVLAEIAKQSGCKGIFFDPEHYDYKPELFSFANHAEMRDKRTFEEYKVVARRRGRELMQSVKDIYPDMTMLCFYAYDLALYDDKHEHKSPAAARYSLLPAFYDGMLEGSDPRTTWNDAWELAYGYKQRSQFLEAYHSIHQKAKQYSNVPELYTAKMRAGFGLMLDYNGGPKWSTDDIGRNHFSPAEWRNAVRNALEISDEYAVAYLQTPNMLTGDKMPDAYLQATAQGRKDALETPQPPLFNAPLDWKPAATAATSATVPAPAASTRTTAPAAANAVPNAGFEETRFLEGATQLASWFIQRWDKSVEDDDLPSLNGSGVTTESKHSGQNAYKLVVSDKVYAKYGDRTVYRMGMLKSKNIPVAEGERLTFSFWYNAENIKGAGDFVLWLHKTGTAEKIEQPLLPVSRIQFDQTHAWRVAGPDPKTTAQENGWTKVEVRDLLVPAGYKVAQLMLQIQGTAPGDYLYFDDVALQR